MSDNLEALNSRVFRAWDRLRTLPVKGAPVGALYKANAFDVLTKSYGAADRVYHGWEHILDLLDKNAAFLVDERFQTLATRPNLIDHAVLWHAVVYKTQNEDGTLRPDIESVKDSAKLFLDYSRLSSADNNAIVAMIMATGSHMNLPPSMDFYRGFMKDRALMVDLDLSSLAAEPTVFDQVGEKIRREFSWVPEKDFCLGRAKILGAFAAHNPIYQTPELEAEWGGRARANLMRSVAELEQRAATL